MKTHLFTRELVTQANQRIATLERQLAGVDPKSDPALSDEGLKVVIELDKATLASLVESELQAERSKEKSVSLLGMGSAFLTAIAILICVFVYRRLTD